VSEVTRHRAQGKGDPTAGRSAPLCRRASLALLPLAACLLSGCALDSWHLLAPKPPPGPADSLVLRGDRLEEEKLPAEGTAAADLAGAHEFYRQAQYDKAESLFAKVADNTKNQARVAEEARFYQAESQRRQGCYPKAAATYDKLLLDFPSTQYREQAVQHMFEIANYWLDDTRTEMEETKEKMAGKRWIVWPHFVHWDKTKPLLDEETEALDTLQQVQYNDIRGPMADKALFLMGSVHFFNEDYRDADHDFSQLVEMHPNSPFASQAMELAIISKHMSTGGPDYDGRKVAEARKLVDTALRNYPDLAAHKSEFLERQLMSINLQQAAKDYSIAEFYRRTSHPGSAYFYYEIVRRRYPNTKYYELATQRMLDLRSELEKAQGQAIAPPAPSPAKPAEEPAPMPRALPSAPQPVPGSPELAPPPRPVPVQPHGGIQ
jgi:outer membrane protein assembly factor BamD (BamD/ComL family)